MKNKIENIITVSLFCSFISIMCILYVVLPKLDFSELEKRYLKEFPETNIQSIVSGDFGNDIETYLADHMPFRDFFVGLNSYFELFTGRGGSSDVYLTKDNGLVEAPGEFIKPNIDKNMNAINKFAESMDVPVDFMIVPSAGWASRNNLLMPSNKYQDSEYINQIYSLSSHKVNDINITDLFDNSKFYYNTDHHWNSMGAYMGYKAYMEKIGVEYREQNDFDIESINDFYGSTYSRAALWLTPSENLELWSCSQNITVTNGESEDVHKGIFYRSRLDEVDKYTVFLDGNHSVVRINNPDAKTDGTILVVRDSYSNCLGGFLCESFENVILVDLRYYKKSVSELCEAENVDNVLICYSMNNFLTDANIIWLR